MFTLNCSGRLLVIDRPIVMGIINPTPDSFYSGSRHTSVDEALGKAEEMLRQGATILDIGGQSTRPGSGMAGADEELKRVIPVIEAISLAFPASFISIDTFHGKVAKEAVAAGAVIVNDISGGSFDKDMIATVASMQTPYVCMHVKGDADTMHSPYPYDAVCKEVVDYFIQKIAACTMAGIPDIILDPGFGFSKSSTENFDLLKYFEVFTMLQKPILLGVSRKSTIYKTLGITANESLNGTTVLHTAGLLKGATILRVHDVKEAMEAITLTRHLL